MESLLRRINKARAQRYILLIVFVFFFFLFGCNTLYLANRSPEKVPPFFLNKPIQIALVLGGGGSRGLAHLGAIKELEAAGLRPDLIIGCSAGAIVGALYADNPNLKGIEKALLSLKRSDLLDVSFFESRFGPVKGQALQKFMKKNLQAQTFDKLQIPLIVVATDLDSGEIVELSQGEIPLAIGASCAFPGIFSPVLVHNRYLIDGGVASPIPVEVAKKYGAKLIIAIDVGEKLPSSKPSHLFGVLRRGMEISYQKLCEKSLAGADIVIKMDFEDVGLFSDGQNATIYEHGRTKTLSILPQIQKLIPQP
jgi:NTE family protein